MSDVMPASVGNAFTKKIGPLPGFAWVLIVVGVVYGVYWWRKRGTASTAGPVPSSGGGAPSAGFSAAGPAPGTNTYSGQVTTYPVGQPAVSTNAMWAKSVTDFLVGTGHYSGTDVSNALTKYLSGQTLSDAERSVIDTAVKQFQTPPEGLVQTAAGPPLAQRWVKFASYVDDPNLYGFTAAGKQEALTLAQWEALGRPGFSRYNTSSGVAHAAGVGAPPSHRYTLSAGENPDTLAAKFYGNSDVSKIINANPGSQYHSGDTVTIP